MRVKERERARVLELEVTVAQERQAAAAKDLEISEVGGRVRGMEIFFYCF